MEIPRYWRTQNQRYTLNGETCPICGARMVTKRPKCIQCSQQGEIILSTQAEYSAIEIVNRQPVSLK